MSAEEIVKKIKKLDSSEEMIKFLSKNMPKKEELIVGLLQVLKAKVQDEEENETYSTFTFY